MSKSAALVLGFIFGATVCQAQESATLSKMTSLITI